MVGLSLPYVKNGALYVTTPDGLQVLDAAGGQTLWSVDQAPVQPLGWVGGWVAAGVGGGGRGEEWAGQEGRGVGQGWRSDWLCGGGCVHLGW